MARFLLKCAPNTQPGLLPNFLSFPTQSRTHKIQFALNFLPFFFLKINIKYVLLDCNVIVLCWLCTLHFAHLLTPIFYVSSDTHDVMMTIDSPEISYILNRTSKNPLAYFQLCWVVWQGTVVKWGDIVVVHSILCSLFILLFGFWVALTSYFNPHTQTVKRNFFRKKKICVVELQRKRFFLCCRLFLFWK